MGNFFIYLFNSLGALKQMCSLVCLKAKNEEKQKKYVSFDQVKNKYLGPKKNVKQKIRFFFLAIVLWSKVKVFANFQKNINF